MSIAIWNLEIYDLETRTTLMNIFFLTKRGAKRYGKKKEEEWAREGWGWTYGGEPLFFGRIKD